MVESSGLLNRRRPLKSTGGSNPPLSASSSYFPAQKCQICRKVRSLTQDFTPSRDGDGALGGFENRLFRAHTPRSKVVAKPGNGGPEMTRTSDLFRVKEAL